MSDPNTPEHTPADAPQEPEAQTRPLGQPEAQAHPHPAAEPSAEAAAEPQAQFQQQPLPQQQAQYQQQPQVVYVQRPPGKFAHFVGHRVTQIVAALVLGLVVGGGVVAIAEHHAGPGPGTSQHGRFGGGDGQHQFPRGGDGG